jgi:long-chain fatty acid transport protein
MILRRFCAITTLALLAITTPKLHADGLVRDGIGAISIGRGGTNLGFSDNTAVIIDNPAAMSNVNCNMFEIGVDTVICDLSYSDADNPYVENRSKAYPSGMLGYIHHDPESCWTWGLGVMAPAGFGAEWDMNNPAVGGPTLYKSFGALGKILPAVSYQVTDDLSIGGYFGLGICHAELEGPFFIQTGAFAGTPTLLDLQSTDVAPTGAIALQYKATEQTTFGVTYTEETRYTMEGNAGVVLLPGPGQLSSEFDAQIDLVWPRSLGVGMQHKLCACRRIGVDIIWYDWSHAFDRLDMNFTNPTNPVVGGLIGGSLRDSLPLGWEDTVSFRLGYEWDMTPCYTLRTGYVYHNSPAPNSTVNPYLDGVLEHAFSVGLSRKLGHGSLNLAYQYSNGPERHVTNSSIVGGDFQNSNFDADAHWACFSLLYPF